MKIKKMGLSLAVISILSLGFSGCGGSGGGDNSSSDSSEGIFADVPVKGIKYESKSYSGFTDDSGAFKYKPGETVTFKIGNLTLGSVIAKDIITPFDIGGGDINNPSIKAKNIAMILQNFDTNRTNTNIITISLDINITDKDINLSANDLESKMSNILNKYSKFLDENNKSVIDLNTAFNNMKNFVKYFKNSGLFTGKATLDTAKSNKYCSKGSTFTVVTNGKQIIGKVLNGGLITGTIDGNGQTSGLTTNHETWTVTFNNGRINGQDHYSYNGVDCYYNITGNKANLKVTLLKDQDIYKGGEKLFTAKKGDTLKIIFAKSCLSNQNEVCLKVKDINLNKIGYIKAETIYKNHIVQKQ